MRIFKLARMRFCDLKRMRKLLKLNSRLPSSPKLLFSTNDFSGQVLQLQFLGYYLRILYTGLRIVDIFIECLQTEVSSNR